MTSTNNEEVESVTDSLEHMNLNKNLNKEVIKQNIHLKENRNSNFCFIVFSIDLDANMRFRFKRAFDDYSGYLPPKSVQDEFSNKLLREYESKPYKQSDIKLFLIDFTYDFAIERNRISLIIGQPAHCGTQGSVFIFSLSKSPEEYKNGERMSLQLGRPNFKQVQLI